MSIHEQVLTTAQPERILLAKFKVDRSDYDQLVVQTQANQDNGEEITSLLNRGEYSSSFFTGAEVREDPNSDLPSVIGTFGVAAALAPERDEVGALAGISRRPAIIEATATSGLARVVAGRKARVTLAVWGYADQPGSYREEQVPASTPRPSIIA